MPQTYSLNVGTITESYRKPDIFSVLQDLPDNTQKLISPRDVRDAFLSTWANSVFKITTPNALSTNEYIGIDTGNPDNRDVKSKLLLGKRSFGNLDIMNSSLLALNDSDIFIYNTKSDGEDQSSTKMAILAGTNSALHVYAPYLESYATGSKIDLNIHNPSVGGAINLFSSTGRVAINGIVFPTAAETGSSASNGRILRYSGTYPSGYLRWDDATLTLTSIGSPGTTTSIYGSPVLVNGYSLEFVDDALVPLTIGGVTQGSSFSADSFTAGGYTTPGTGQNWPIVEVMRKILYPYIEPVLELSVYNTALGTTYAEVGTTISVSVTFSVTTYARESSEEITKYLIKDYTLPGTNNLFYSQTFSETPGTSTYSSFTFSEFYGSTGSGIKTYQLLASTITFSSTASLSAFVNIGGGFSFSVSDEINFISPFALSFESFSTFSNVAIRDVLIGSSVEKLVAPFPGASQSVKISKVGSGYLYFAYPSSYGPLSYIKDPNGYVLHDVNSPIYSAFTYSSSFTPTGFYSYYGPYYIYRMIATCSNALTAPFEFIF